MQDFMQSMKMSMELKGFAKSTQRTYLAHIKRYADFCGTFRYRDYRDQQTKLLTLSAMEFIRRFLQHVLPSGLQRIRYYGILSNCNRKRKLLTCLRLTRTRIRSKVKLTAKDLIRKLTGVDISVCASCGGQWCTVSSFHPNSS